MIYVALLRGINVGGNNKLSMQDLKLAFENIGMTNISTYINSGNVIFESELSSTSEITDILEQAIHDKFGFAVDVVVVDRSTFLNIANSLPENWVNDAAMRCDVMFLWDDVDHPEIMERLVIKPDIDEAIYVKGAVLWCIADRKNVTKSGMLKMLGTNDYKRMTIRNCNTVRKLAAILSEY